MNPDEDNQVKEDSPLVPPTVHTAISETRKTLAGGANLHPCKGNVNVALYNNAHATLIHAKFVILDTTQMDDII